MQSQYVTDAVALAKKLVATADFINQHYSTYRDGRGNTHYVNGPACKQLRDISMQLTFALSDMRRRTAAALPAMPEVIAGGSEYEFLMDIDMPYRPERHTARALRSK